MEYKVFNQHYKCVIPDFMNELVNNSIPCLITDNGSLGLDIQLKHKDTGAQHFIQQFLLPAGANTKFHVCRHLGDDVSYLDCFGHLKMINIKERLVKCICSKEKFGFAGHAGYCSISNFKE